MSSTSSTSSTSIRARYWWPLSVAAILLSAAGAVAYHKACYTYGLEGAKPWFGDWAPMYAQDTGPRRQEASEIWPMFVAAAAVVAWLALLIWRRRWSAWLLLPAVIVTLTVNWSTARIDGPGALTEPFSRAHLEYFGDVPRVGDDPIQFIVDYPRLAAEGFWTWGRKLSGHARTHPPGGVLILWAAGYYIDPSLGTATWTAIVLSALSIIPALLWVRELVDDETTMLAAALYVVTPGLVMFGATCMDGVFTLPTITALWLGERSLRGKTSERIAISLAAGVMFAVAFFFTFAASVIGILLACRVLVTIARRDWPHARNLALTGVLAVVAFLLTEITFAAMTGYDRIANIHAAIKADHEYMQGSGKQSLLDYLDVSTANLMAFLITAGIASVALSMLGVWRDRKVLAYAIGLLCIGFSTLFTLETERVWMFLYPIPVAAAALGIAALASHRQRAVALALFVVLVLSQTLWVEWAAYTHW